MDVSALLGAPVGRLPRYSKNRSGEVAQTTRFSAARSLALSRCPANGSLHLSGSTGRDDRHDEQDNTHDHNHRREEERFQSAFLDDLRRRWA
jgi:hypothetical protein